MSQVGSKRVEELSTAVSEADKHRNDADNPNRFAEVRKIFLGILSKNDPELQAALQQVAEEVKHPDHHWASMDEAEYLAIGYLGLARAYFVSEIAALKDGDVLESDLRDTAEYYQTIFKTLDFLNRAPHSIHGGLIDWLAEHSQDLIAFHHAVGETSQAVTLATSEINRLEAELTAEDHQNALHLAENPGQLLADHRAGKISGLGVLKMRRGRMTGNVQEIYEAYKLVMQSHDKHPNPNRAEYVSKVLTVEALFNARQTPLATTIKAVLTGGKTWARLAIQRKLKVE